MRNLFLLAVSAALVLGLATGATAKPSKDDWLPSDKITEALGTAAKQEVPVALLLEKKNANNSKHDGRVAAIEGLTELNGMIKVRLYDSVPREVMPIFQDVVLQYVPALLLVDSECHLLGYGACESTVPEIRDMAKQVAAAMQWKKKAKADLETIQNNIDKKQFVAAVKGLETLNGQDVALHAVLDKGIQASNAKAEASIEEKAKEDGKAGAKDKDKDKDKAAAKNPGAKAKKPPAAVGEFFTKEVADLRRNITKAVEATCKEVEAAVAAGDLKQARTLVGTLSALRLDAATNARIKDLSQQVAAAARSGAAAEAKPAAPAAQAPDAEAPDAKAP